MIQQTHLLVLRMLVFVGVCWNILDHSELTFRSILTFSIVIFRFQTDMAMQRQMLCFTVSILRVLAIKKKKKTFLKNDLLFAHYLNERPS